MTTFKSMLQQCGLSQSEAASFLGVSLQSVKAWSSGHRPNTPLGVFNMLVSLHQQIRDLAYDAAEEMIENGGPDEKAFINCEVDDPVNPLPFYSCRQAVGALALLLALDSAEWED